jgi:hypothetical protein
VSAARDGNGGSDPQPRFQFIAATGKYPPMILDTVTGCVQTIEWLGQEGQSSLDLSQMTRGGKQHNDACDAKPIGNKK